MSTGEEADGSVEGERPVKVGHREDGGPDERSEEVQWQS
jgi:hypothetical protein